MQPERSERYLMHVRRRLLLRIRHILVVWYRSLLFRFRLLYDDECVNS